MYKYLDIWSLYNSSEGEFYLIFLTKQVRSSAVGILHSHWDRLREQTFREYIASIFIIFHCKSINWMLCNFHFLYLSCEVFGLLQFSQLYRWLSLYDSLFSLRIQAYFLGNYLCYSCRFWLKCKVIVTSLTFR